MAVGSKEEADPQSSVLLVAKLLASIEKLSLARNLQAIMDIVRHEARELLNADGATFVLREGDNCYYAEEDAIEPLWKGKRFPMKMCISGWVMINGQWAAIEDIYADSRIPADVYRPTFVKSMVMVPIRSEAPIGAIGIYWAKSHKPTDQELRLLQSFANSTAVAIENVELSSDLDQRKQNSSQLLESLNKEIEAFSYSLSYDLRSPIHSIRGFSALLKDQYQHLLDQEGLTYLDHICSAAENMSQIVEDLAKLAQISVETLANEAVNLSELAHSVFSSLSKNDPERPIKIYIEKNHFVQGDPKLLTIMMENLLQNAWKATAKNSQAKIEFFATPSQENGKTTFILRDNGKGFNVSESITDFSNISFSLTVVSRILARHNGHLQAESSEAQGTTLFITL